MEPPDYTLVDTGPLPYLLSVPFDDSAPPQARPVLCFLHGYGEAAPMAIDRALTLHGPLRSSSSSRARREFIIFAPQLPQAGDIWHRYTDAVRDILAEVQHAHRGDPRQTFLTGFSFGGNGVFDLAADQPDLWAALWAVDPTRVPSSDLRQPIWLSFGEVARRIKPFFIRALDLRPAEDPLTRDRFYLDEGQDHVGSATFAYRDDRIYQWLLSRANRHD